MKTKNLATNGLVKFANDINDKYKPWLIQKKGSEKMQNSLINEIKKICNKYGYKLTELTIEELNND